MMNTWIKWLSGSATTGREESQRKVMTMLGACRVTIQGGRFRCSCTGGHLIHLSSSNDLSQKCTGCDHRLAEHDDFPGTLSRFHRISFIRRQGRMLTCTLLWINHTFQYRRINLNPPGPLCLSPANTSQTRDLATQFVREPKPSSRSLT